MAKRGSPDPKVPPYSLEAEQAVLGGLMLSEAALDKVVQRLEEKDFYNRSHQIIYRAICQLGDARKPYDAVTLGEWFEQNGLAEEVGGAAYVVQLANATPSAANIMAYVDIVRDRALMRQLLDASTAIAGDVFAPEGRPAATLIENAEQAVFAIAERGARGRHGAVTMRESVRAAFDVLQRRATNPGALLGVATGFMDLDKMLSGLQDGDLIILAARPSMGKTALALGIAEHAAVREDKAVAIFSMEMSHEQLTLRMTASLGRIDAQNLRNGDLDEVDWSRVSAAYTTLAASKIVIDDAGALTPVEVRARARRLKREHDIDLIVVDYLQLMKAPDSSENRATEVAEISRSLKALAKELKVPILALSQLNRAVEQRTDKRPLMSDLRESGGLEQDADVILFIYRDEYYDKESPDKGTAEIIIAKQRNGPTGTVRLAFIGAETAFRNLSHAHS
jgi:replicative DNA helicase